MQTMTPNVRLERWTTACRGLSARRQGWAYVVAGGRRDLPRRVWRTNQLRLEDIREQRRSPTCDDQRRPNLSAALQRRAASRRARSPARTRRRALRANSMRCEGETTYA